MLLMHRTRPAALSGLLALLTLLLVLAGGGLAGCGSGSNDTAQNPASNGAALQRGEPATPDSVTTVLVLGNSIAAGYGLAPGQSFPALLQQKVDALGWSVKIINAGVSGSTTAGGLQRLDWHLRQHIDVLLIELGGNDGLRGLPVEITKQNLQAIIDDARAAYPDVRIVLAGMRIPPNMGEAYAERFRAIYPALAEANDIALVPLLLEGVAGQPALNQPDGIHPTAEGQRLVAENVWTVLRPVLAAVRQAENAVPASAAR